MDLYSFFKLLHVITAIAWVGGGLTLLALASFNIRDHGPAGAILSSQLAGSLAIRWFVPASGLTLVFGLIATFLGNLWSEAWVILGLLGFAATFFTGHFILRVKAERAGELMSEGRESEAIQQSVALMRVSKFDYTVILMVVAAMVLKPTWTDFVALGAMAAIIVVSGVFFLVLSPQAPTAAPAE